MSQILAISRSADAAPIIKFHIGETPSPTANEVLVKLLAAPINPLDLLVVANLYPVKPSYHHDGEAIPGYDGVGEVVSVGADVKDFVSGDIVVPSKFGLGTWRTHLAVDAQSLQKIDRPADIAFAAILRITIAPAYCLVEDMATLRPGDWIIQNAGTSVIAQTVVQFARRRGVNVISVVRDRPAAELDIVKRSLRELGAGIVVSESELSVEPLVKTKRVTLALDSVFGSSGRGLVKALSAGGVYVQLGFLGGKEQLSLDPSDLFGRQLTMKAFRGSSQVGVVRSAHEQRDLFNWFITLFNAGELVTPPLGLPKVEWELSDESGSKQRLLQAIAQAQEGSLGQRKQVILVK